MSERSMQAVILAGGLGTRMKSRKPKVLHDILGHPMVWYVAHAVSAVDACPILVTPASNEEFAHVFGNEALLVVQSEQLGSGHAARCGLQAVHADYVLICSGDNPIPTSADYAAFTRAFLEARVDAAVLTNRMDNPGHLGRVLRGPDGSLERIVEARDATAAELDINEVNTGIYLFRTGLLRSWLERIKPDNAQGELYLTDCMKLARQDGSKTACFLTESDWEISGVNDRVELAAAARILGKRKLESLQRAGVTINTPQTVRIEWDVEVGDDTEILQGCCLSGNTSVGEGSVIGPDATLVNARVGRDVSIQASFIQDAIIGDRCTIGPFSYVRPGCVLDTGVKIGAFCEVKASTIGQDSKIPHLSYIGDATIASGVNVGAGTITCNYDGFTHEKHRTIIERNVFVGANCNLVAPVAIHEGAYTATGSTITHDVPAGALAVARCAQVDKEGWVGRKKHGE
ncbi:MAG: bifunctional UDP-N-acetylglucosamine diphosphorylase/glucosamine-1-phosphate N-acetyltransferase GlmU [Caldisericota bacterium]|jgi:bifunctional UDP-N-acetylglucosamine pyrophosphorylase/glucosamine-1-phosphate N-acetyltransferase|nr:bifunctional UDP-N-acetylglucosamine diphosphorylase/glucosamine-1-phosphate N-acetyltransferase GlmU [Caldisericota bacterium]